MAEPTVSVVIPAYNEEHIISACLQSLSFQETTEPFEVIVVDNKSTDKTAEVARGFSELLDIRVIREEQQGRGAARKAGFAAARGEFILSTDADATVPTDWIATLSGVLRSQPDAVAVTGPAKIMDCSPFKNWLLTGLFSVYIRIDMTLKGYTCMNGFNFAVRKSVYEKVGGFDARNDAQEDMELTLRIKNAGRIALVKVGPVISGRRFKRGVLRAWWEYTWTFIAKFILKRERVELSNVK